jgi:hypothetical protein
MEGIKREAVNSVCHLYTLFVLYRNDIGGIRGWALMLKGSKYRKVVHVRVQHKAIAFRYKIYKIGFRKFFHVREVLNIKIH